MIQKVASLSDLRQRAEADDKYRALAIMAAQNLGGSCETLEGAMTWLRINAQETDEEGVVQEVNACRDLVEDA